MYVKSLGTCKDLACAIKEEIKETRTTELTTPNLVRIRTEEPDEGRRVRARTTEASDEDSQL